MSANIPECPPSLKAIQHFLKTAAEHDARDPTVAYWCRLHALQAGLKLTNKKTPEETKVLMAIMDWLEEAKKIYKDNEAISNEVVAQAHLENYALKLFMFADKQDREQNYGKNVVKAFYTAGVIYEVLTTFGDLTDEAAQNRKYARWKAAYIHNCLKTGETPVPGPMQNPDGSIPDEDSNKTGNVQPGSSDAQSFGFNQPGSTDSQSFGFNQPGSTDSQSFGFNQPGSTDSQGFGFPNVTPATPPTVPTSFNNSLPDPNLVMRAASQLPPVPYTPDPNPGGFEPYDPSQQPQPSTPPTNLYGDNSINVAQLSPEQIQKAQKYCKWAGSALNYDDVKTAIVNLKNALELLQTGRDPA